MNTFRAVYYPSWNPSVRYVRSLLLFFDTIEVIIPAGEEGGYHRLNAQLYERQPELFNEFRHSSYTMGLDDEGWNRFDTALRVIAAKPAKARSGVNVRLVTLIPTHLRKVESEAYRLLRRHNLIDGEDGNFLRVQQDASHLLLSGLADNFARKKGLQSVTDKAIPYTLNYLNAPPHASADSVPAILANSIIRLEIPRTIATLRTDEYIALRARYEEIRKPFQRTMTALSDDHRLNKIEDRNELSSRLADITRDFDKAVKAFRGKKFYKQVESWTKFTAGSALRLIGVYPTLSAKLISAGGQAAIQLYDNLKVERYEDGEAKHAARLMYGMRQDLLKPKYIRRFIRDIPED